MYYIEHITNSTTYYYNQQEPKHLYFIIFQAGFRRNEDGKPRKEQRQFVFTSMYRIALAMRDFQEPIKET